MVSSNYAISTTTALFVLLLSTSSLFAKSWTPDNDFIVLTYEKNTISNQLFENTETKALSSKQIDNALDKIESLIYNSRLPGKSSNLTPATLNLKQIDAHSEQLSSEQQNRLLLAQANLAQQSHHFNEAIEHLNNISTESYLLPQALLIQSRIYQIQANYSAAENSCNQLLNKQTQAAQLCLLETKGYQGQSNEVHQALKLLEPRYSGADDDFKRFFYQVMGSNARLNGDFKEAQESFSFKLQTAPASQWYQWSDMSFNNGDAQLVYEKISHLNQTLDKNSSLEDGFIVRLARAEKALGLSKEYQKLAQQRVALRILRGDSLHAADIAYYYLYVSPDKAKALKWAKRNWSSVKEPSDNELLQQAKQINNQ